MTLGNLLSQMGVDTKHLTERHSHAEYSAPTHESHMFYAYEPTPSHGHVPAPKHHYGGGGGGHKNNAAMSALTLLAFLFFLHILQQCLKDHMMAMSSTPPVMIMTAGREGEEAMPKRGAINKMDKSGKTKSEAKHAKDVSEKSKMISDHTNTKYDDENDASNKETFLKIKTAEYTPKTGAHKFKHVYANYGNRSLSFPGFVSAMNADSLPPAA